MRCRISMLLSIKRKKFYFPLPKIFLDKIKFAANGKAVKVVQFKQVTVNQSIVQDR